MKPFLWFALFVIAVRLLLMAWVPLTDPSEGRYAHIALNMATTNQWVLPEIWVDGEKMTFMGKPPAYFWAGAASIRIFGQNEFAVRLPNVLAAILIGLMAWVVARRYGPAGSPVLAVSSLVSSAFFFVMCGTAMTDTFLALGVTGAVLSYFAFLREDRDGPRRNWSRLVFLFLAFGFLTKGPVAIALFGMPVFVYTLVLKDWKRLRHHAWFSGFGLFFVITVPWFVLAEMKQPGLLRYFFINENFLRFTSHDYGDLYGHGHTYPRGTAIVMMIAAAFPGILIGVKRLGGDLWSIRRLSRTDSARFFFLLAFIVPTLFWCLARQILITYMLPAVPAFCMWLAFAYADKVPLLLRRKAVIGLVCLYAAAMIVGGHFLTGMTSKVVLRRLDRTPRAGNDSPYCFVRRTPNSAYFYAPDKLLVHPKEYVVQSVSRFMDQASPDTVLICAERYVPKLSAEALAELEQIDRIDGWRVYRKRTDRGLEKPVNAAEPGR